MSDTAKSPLPLRWLLVCLLPLFTAVYFHFFPATPGSSGFLINGIIYCLSSTSSIISVLFNTKDIDNG